MKNHYLNWWAALSLFTGLCTYEASGQTETIERPFQIGQYQSLYMSSPVQSHTIGDALPATPLAWTTHSVYRIHKYHGVNGWTLINSSETMIPGKGYILTTGGNGIFGQIGTDTVDYPQTYIGVPNDGTISIEIPAADTANLLGNPYKDFLDADLFLLDSENATVISGPISLWTKNTIAADGVEGNDVFNFSTNDYALYNVLGGCSAGRSVTYLAEEQSYNQNIPNGKIYKGTAFFVPGIATGYAKFKNEMRVTTADTQYFRPGTTTATPATVPERHRIWINLEKGDGSSNESPFRQALIGYADGATTADDDRVFDAVSLADSEILIDVYSFAPSSTKHLAIQGKWPFNVTDVFPLGIKVVTGASQDYTFTAQGDGMFAPNGQRYFLRDTATGGGVYEFPRTYTFNADTTLDNRFQVVFSNCHTNLTAMNTAIYTTAVPGATSYEWHITNLETNQTAIYTTTTLYTHLTAISNALITPAPTSTTPFLSYGTTYTIYAVPNVGAAPYPAVCTVTTPTPNVSINCTGVAACTQITLTGILSNTLGRNYNISLVGPSSTQTFTIPYSPGSFKLTDPALGLNLVYGESYTLQVQVANPGGEPLTFSASCPMSIFIPSTIGVNECGTRLPSVCANITITDLENCLRHNYNVTVTDPFSTVTNYSVAYSPGNFRLPTLPFGVNPFDLEYTITVQIANDIALPVGTSCIVETPLFPTTSMKSGVCGTTIASSNTYINAYVLPYSAYCDYSRRYIFRLTNSALGYSQTWTNPSIGFAQFQLNKFTGLQTNTVYNVEVAAVINGVQGPWSTATCTITTPSTLRPSLEAAEFKVLANPNPFESGFSLSIDSQTNGFVKITVYDMLGRLIESRDVKPAAFEYEVLGQTYAAGVYNILVTQGQNQKTVRVIKQ